MTKTPAEIYKETRDMTAIKQFIEDAVAGGWSESSSWFDGTVIKARVLLDPEAWQAVEKTRGWEPESYYHLDYRIGNEVTSDIFQAHKPQWHFFMHRFIDLLAEGLSFEEALKKLEI